MSTMGDTTAGAPYTGGEAQGASSGSEQAKEKVQETAQQAAGQARGQIRRQVDERSTQAGEQVSSTAGDVRSMAQQLREQGKEQPAKIAEQAADRAERLGTYLKQADGEAILRDVEDFGRRQPWAVMVGGLAAGFLASRFLKASSSRRAQSDYTAPPRQGANGLSAVPPVPAPSSGPTATPPMQAPDAPVQRDPVPPLGRPAENVSLSGGVLPPQTPGATRPGGTS
jgi:gas vesicle protein